MADRNFSILPHDPFLDMTFPRPLRESLKINITWWDCFNCTFPCFKFWLYFLRIFFFIFPWNIPIVFSFGWWLWMAWRSSKRFQQEMQSGKIRKYQICNVVRSENIGNIIRWDHEISEMWPCRSENTRRTYGKAVLSYISMCIST